MAEEQLIELAELVDEVFRGTDRLSRDEIVQQAVLADLGPELKARLDALPEGEYSADEALEALVQVPDEIPFQVPDETR